MKPGGKFLKSLIEVSHIEFQAYDFQRHELIFSSGLGQRILGYSKEDYEKLSRDFYEKLIHPDDIPIMHQAIEKLIHSSPHEVIEMTARYRRSDGNYIWIYTRKLVSERNKKGEPRTITTIAEDITVMIQLRDELREKVELLESISYKNSHLVRSPVASIIGLINLIEEKDIISAHNMEILNYLKDAIEKLDAVIHEINDIIQN
ncbi:MAG TPA: PAS domain-containing protein [Mucilaginibacter sp.]|jgi:PAS domain S-box-containing protein|nr:PAS domain-containing protein [Mucilaginibacter sp.]